MLCGCVLPAYAHRSAAWAAAAFSKAQQLHNALESRPAQQLTRDDYERVIAAYKRVYLGSPTSSKADPSVINSAELMEEEGRRLNDQSVLRAAIKQYQFLRQQYPGSKARFNALFRIGEIYKDDLHEKKHADEAFQQFVQLYPRHRLAEQARQELAQPIVPASVKTEQRKAESTRTPIQRAEEKSETEQDTDEPNDPDHAVETTHGLVPVTGVHQWSTPNSTRVAIDLGSKVKFYSQRIENPDRIFFDLLQTRLDRSLWRKSFAVNDGLLKEIRVSQFKPGRTRVVLEVEKAMDFKASLEANPPRLVVEVWNHSAPATASAQKTAGILAAGLKPRLNREQTAAVDSDTKPQESADASEKPTKAAALAAIDTVKKRVVEADDSTDGGDDSPRKPVLARLNPPETGTTKEIPPEPLPAKTTQSRATKSRKVVVPEPDAHEAQPTAAGDRSLIRALDLKIGKIVIDPGHGGHDTGTIGPNGLEEKDLVLDVSKRLGRLLATRLGAEVVYTRTDNTFIPLEERTAIANRESADLFISIHANSSSDPDARGVETYYLNFTSSRDALEVAARENAVSEKSIHELQDLVKTIALKEKIEESHEFATDVEYSLHKGLSAKNPGIRDRGVKKAPFIVLIGANMPSILAEISFVSNPGDERRLKTTDFRQRIAESLYRGIAKYVNGLSGVKVASKVDKEQGQ